MAVKAFAVRILFNDLTGSDGKTHADFYVHAVRPAGLPRPGPENRLGRTHTVITQSPDFTTLTASSGVINFCLYMSVH